MKSSLLKWSLVIIVMFLSVGIQNTQAKEENNTNGWTYACVIDGITYKLHLAQEKGTWTVQVYDSKSNKWTYGQVLSSTPDKGYWKIKDGAGKVWDLTTYGNDYCIIKDSSGYTVKYWAE